MWSPKVVIETGYALEVGILANSVKWHFSNASLFVWKSNRSLEGVHVHAAASPEIHVDDIGAATGPD